MTKAKVDTPLVDPLYRQPMGTPKRRFGRVLVANRGEIAVRIAQTLRDMGVTPIGVCIHADAQALHARVMAQVIWLDGLGQNRGYLDVAALIEAAKKSGAEAIHPGYGFVSEDPNLAVACQQAGIVLIGPSAHAITTMGSKTAARDAMRAAGVPVIPGSPGPLVNSEQASSCAAKMGYPVMLKAAAGGGGKGIRLVDAPGQLAGALRAVRSEAEGAFGDSTIYMEKALIAPRHIEMQVMADNFGHVFTLGERECSLQRRHQKVIEEAPAASLPAATRDAMAAVAIDVARAVDYVGAGTVEFLLDARGEFYFLEMNTRLQVEHPVTEMCHGVDLVALQLQVAAGNVLTAEDIGQGCRGHAIEARLYAEDPLQKFLPAPGEVHDTIWPAGPGIRVDAGVAPGCVVTPLFDPMVAKIIAWGCDREQARRRLRRALCDTHVRGLTTNKGYLLTLLDAPDFVAGCYHTNTLDELGPPTLARPPAGLPMQAAISALVVRRFLADEKAGGHLATADQKSSDASNSWQAMPWRLEAS